MMTQYFLTSLRRQSVVYAGGMAAALSLLAAAPAGAATVLCSDMVLGAVTVDSVEVEPGRSCQLDGTTVLGSVLVKTGGTLIAGNGVQVSGSISADQASHVELTGVSSFVAGSFNAVKGGSAILASAEVLGSVTLEEMGGAVSVGDVRVGSGMKVVKNTGGASVANNTVVGSLQCFDNSPAPAVGGNSADALEGQCVQATSPPPPTPPSGNVTCVGLTLVGLNLDSVFVPDNTTCTLIGTTMNGSVEVGTNATLVAQDVFITGNLIADGAADVSISGDSSIGGSVQVQRGAGASILDAGISGSLQITAMAGPVEASGNQIGGNTQAFSNLGGVTLTDNSMTGVLQCTGNTPAPTGGGNVASQKDGQCAGL